MDSKDIVIEALGRIKSIVARTLDGLTAEQLAYRPTEQANSIAWLAWHLTRVQDMHIADLAGREEAWIEEGWYEKFDKAADKKDTGQRYTPEQVAALRPESPKVLLDYHDAVYNRSVEYLQNVTPEDMDRVLNEPRFNPMPTVGVRLVSICADNLQHAGQAAYLKGCIQEKHWYEA